MMLMFDLLKDSKKELLVLFSKQEIVLSTIKYSLIDYHRDKLYTFIDSSQTHAGSFDWLIYLLTMLPSQVLHAIPLPTLTFMI